MATEFTSATKIVSGAKITICLTNDQGLSIEDGGKWLLLCETHGYILQGKNKSRLWGWADQPEMFCAGCKKAK